MMLRLRQSRRRRGVAKHPKTAGQSALIERRGKVIHMADTRKSMGAVMLAVVAVGFVGLVVALVLNWIAGADFSPWTNYISDLSVGEGGASSVYFIQMLLIALLSALFFYGSMKTLRSSYGNGGWLTAGVIFGTIGSIDTLVMIFFPLDPMRPAIYTTHVWTGVIIFVCIAVYAICYSVVFRGSSGPLGASLVVAVVMAVLSVAFSALLALTELTHTIGRHAATYLIEWTAFSLFAVWMLMVGLGLRRSSG